MHAGRHTVIIALFVGALCGQTTLGVLGTGPKAGFQASGRAVISTPAGNLGGAVHIEIWGSRHCRVTVLLPSGRFERVVNNGRSVVLGPGGLAQLLPIGGNAENCDLLPQGLSVADLNTADAIASEAPSGEAPAGTRRLIISRPARAGLPPAAAARIASASRLLLDLDQATGNPVRAAFTAATGQSVEDIYSAYSVADGVSFPARIEKRVSGVTRMVIDLDDFAPRAGFTESDFPLPAPRQRPSVGAKGGR
ncbi:MAG TPA: hypothetical protein VN690_09030 [Terriglobales bacterium]|nr:hypothetical protein [Terriglobales bacterium]